MICCSNCGKSVKECKCIPDWFKEETQARVDKYKKYHNDYEKFIKNFPDVVKGKVFLWLDHHNFENMDGQRNEFNVWLFDHCFEGEFKEYLEDSEV